MESDQIKRKEEDEIKEEMKGDKKNKEKEIRGKVNEEDINMRKKSLEIRTG